MARGKLRIKPQPPIDRWAHPTGARPKWVALALIGLGVLLGGVAAGREHDVFGDGALILSEGSLMRAVTVGGPRKPAPAPPPPSELDLAIMRFLGDQAGDLADESAQAALKKDREKPYDFCPT